MSDTNYLQECNYLIRYWRSRRGISFIAINLACLTIVFCLFIFLIRLPIFLSFSRSFFWIISFSMLALLLIVAVVSAKLLGWRDYSRAYWQARNYSWRELWRIAGGRLYLAISLTCIMIAPFLIFLA